MAGLFSDLLSSNNPKLDEFLAKTRDVAEAVGKKSAEHLDLSRKRIELLDVKSKQSKLFEKFGKLQYSAFIGETVDEEELSQLAGKISANVERIAALSEEIEEAKAKFAESVQRTKEAFQKEWEKASPPKAEVDLTEFFETEEDTLESEEDTLKED
ncbi:MAG: hypothetical protein J1E81_00780 [Eubacterium sp.]|nr:hypothetical protein [Eubacterium sp.]